MVNNCKTHIIAWYLCDLVKLAIRIIEGTMNLLLMYRLIRAIELEDIQYYESKSKTENKAFNMKSPTGSKFRYWMAGKFGQRNME